VVFSVNSMKTVKENMSGTAIEVEEGSFGVHIGQRIHLLAGSYWAHFPM